MKCERCGNELRIGNEQVGFDENKNPVIHQFAYCDNCRIKTDITLQQQKYSNVEKPEKPPAKKDSVLSIAALIFSLFGCLAIVGFIMAIIDLCMNDKKTRHIGSVVALVFCGIWLVYGISDYTSSNTNSNEQTTSTVISDENNNDQEIIIDSNNETENIVEEPVIEYQIVDTNTLLDELENNALKAEKTYQDLYLEITGELSVIDSDGEYISLDRTDDEISFLDITCNVTNEEQLNKILEMSIGDKIIVKGKITDIGEILGYILEIHDLQIIPE